MNITNSRIMFGLNASATSSQYNISGDFQIGGNIESYSLNATKAYTLRANCPEGGSFTFNPTTGVAEQTTEWDGGYAFIRVTGELTSDGTSPVEIPDLFNTREHEGKPEYRSTDLSSRLLWISPEVGWELYYTDNNDINTFWYSTEDVASPELVTTWISYNMETGNPILTKISPYQIFGGDGKDFDGVELGTITPTAMLVKTSVSISVDLLETNSHIDIPANGVLLFKEVPQETQWTFTAESSGTVEITVLG